MDDFELVFGVFDHFLEDLDLVGEFFFCHLVDGVFGFELLLVVDGDCSAGTEFVVGEGTGEGDDVEVVEIHFVVLSGHLPIELGDNHTIKFFKLPACCKNCQLIIGLFPDRVK